MNFNLLSSLVEKSKMGKAQIAEMAKISRTTLDNALNGADIKISTIESLSDVLGVSPSVFFGADNDTNEENLNIYEKEIKRLQTLLDNQRKSTKVVVELDVTPDEFIKMGLKDKVIQVLSK
jgi:transcriptional regulator with XRE-family HTH domain